MPLKPVFYFLVVLVMAGCLDQQSASAPAVGEPGNAAIVDRSLEEGVQPPPEPELYRAGGG